MILMDYDFRVKPMKIMFEHKHMDGFLQVGTKYEELSERLFSLGYKFISLNTEDTIFELDI